MLEQCYLHMKFKSNIDDHLNTFCAHTKGSMSSIESRSNDLRQEVSQEALEAQRVEKLVRHLRRQVTNGSCDEETSR